MSALAETLLTAFGLSGLAAASLLLLPGAPPRVRLFVAAGGLTAWLVPWGALRIAIRPSDPSTMDAAGWLAFGQEALAMGPAQWGLDTSAALAYAFALASLAGLAVFALDCLALRGCLRAWRARSRAADELRGLLPPQLAGAAVDIRIVERSAMAATSGWPRPTIWLGERLSDSERRLALLHEAWHVRAGDPLWLVLITAVRRVYWWNPLVAFLARHAALMIESRCDHRCALQLGKAAYVARLAAMLLAVAAREPPLVAGIGTANLAVQRLRLLDAPLRLRARDVATLGALAAASIALAAGAVVERAAAPSSTATATLPATPAGQALAALLRATNAGDADLVAELLGAWTPQEVPLPLPRSPTVRVVQVLWSEPLRIEYVVESRDGGRHAGGLAVAASTNTISAARLEPLR